MDNTERICQCIFNIEVVSNTIQGSKKRLIQLNIPHGDPLDADIMFYSYVKICSILEEFKVLNEMAETDHYLEKVMKAFLPITRYVSNYKPGFLAVRNTLVAHFGRKDDGTFKPYWKELMQWKVPRSMAELNYIYDII